MAIPDHLTCLLKNLYAGQEAIVRTGLGTGSILGKQVCQGCVYCHSAYLTYMQSTSCKMPGWLDEAQAGIKVAGRNINKLRYADDTTLRGRSEEKLKSHLLKVKEENKKSGLELNIQETKIIASGPITSWQIDGETMETVRGLIFGAPKSLQMVTAAMKLKDACSLEEKL